MPFTDPADRPPAADVVTTRDGSRTLAGPGGGEGYKSLAGALTEARHVYLEGSGVAARLAAGEPTRVLEVGFGTGLLFLVTAAVAERSGAPLDYLGLEQSPPPAELLAELGYEELLAPSRLPQELLAWRAAMAPTPAAGVYHLDRAPVRLELRVGDARQLPTSSGFHAVYHDAFSPATSPELWTPTFLAELAARLAPGGHLVSFCVASSVRRALAAAGLEVHKRPGPPGGKREVLMATRPTAA